MDKKYLLDREDAVLLIVDIQDKLAVVMKEREQVIKNCLHLIELAKMIKIPVVVTEQYPKGLGRTVPELQAVMPGYRPVEKIAFNCCGEPSFLAEISRINRKKVIVSRHGNPYLRAPNHNRVAAGRVHAARGTGCGLFQDRGKPAGRA